MRWRPASGGPALTPWVASLVLGQNLPTYFPSSSLLGLFAGSPVVTSTLDRHLGVGSGLHDRALA